MAQCSACSPAQDSRARPTEPRRRRHVLTSRAGRHGYSRHQSTPVRPTTQRSEVDTQSSRRRGLLALSAVAPAVTSPRIVQLLDKPLNTLCEDEFREIFCEFPDKIAYVMARLKSRPEDPVTIDQIGLQLELAWR
jgi:hypothetical protein